MCSNLDIHDFPDEKITDSKMKLNFEWNKINLNNENFNANNSNDKKMSNIILKNKILKLENSPFSLRTLGIEIEISLLMAGESNLWIFTRCQNEITLNSVVCQISKEQKSTRKFISFGVMDTHSNEDSFCIKTLKKQEVPKHGKLMLILIKETYSQDLDISEVKIIINENGDRQYLVSIENSKDCIIKKVAKTCIISFIQTSLYRLMTYRM